MILAMKTAAPYLFLLYFLSASVYAEIRVSINQISEEMDEKKVEIGGFVYLLENGEAILASQPDLKSCCVGASHRSHEQIALKDLKSIPTTKQPIRVKGILRFNRESGRMTLWESEAVPRENRFHLIFASATAGIVFTILLLQKRKA